MVLNFTDPFLTTRVLGFESLFDRLQRFSETTERSSSYPPYTLGEIKIRSLLMLPLLVSQKKTSTLSWQKAY